MPLFDLFKKPSKKEPAGAPQKESMKSSTDEALFSPEMQKKRYDAAREFLKSFQERMPLIGGKPHAGTALAVVARLAGTSLHRSLNYKGDITPGVVVLSDKVNEAWPELMNLFAFYCRQNGVDVMAKPVVTVFPEKDQPRMSVEEVQQEYQDQYDEVMKRHGLDYLDGARAGMVVCSIIFQYHCTVAKDIDPYVGTGIVARGVVEGAKTAPPPFGSRPSIDRFSEENVKKMNDRLVLGEREAVIQETKEQGGVHVDPNPQVLEMFKQSNLDPYLIYEKAVLNQIEKKISRIDFVQADVDQLFDEWKGKPEGEVPIHVRLIIWLKNNAKTYGYEQHRNSWVLKK